MKKFQIIEQAFQRIKAATVISKKFKKKKKKKTKNL